MKKIVSVTLVVCMMLSLCVVPMASGVQTFWDVPESHWAYSHVMNMVEREVVSGYPDGGFHPDAYLTRAEAATMIAKIGGSQNSTYSGFFADVTQNDWFCNYVEGVKQYFNSYTENNGTINFRPNDYATREDVIVALMKRNSGQELYEVKSPATAMTYTDFANVRKENQPYFEEAINQGIVTGYADGTVRPHGNLTRAEMVTLLSKIYGVPLTLEEMFALGQMSYTFGCTLEEFIERYNNAVSANYDMLLQANDYASSEKDLTIGKAIKAYENYGNWYDYNPFATVIRENQFKGIDDSQGYLISSISSKLIFELICKDNRVVWINRQWGNVKNGLRENRKFFSENRFITACMLSATTGMSFNEAFEFIEVSACNPYFNRMGNAYFNLNSGFTITDINSIGNPKFGLAETKPSSDVGALDISIDKLIEKFNNNVIQNFKYVTEYGLEKQPSDYLINPNGFIREEWHEYDGKNVEVNRYYAGPFEAFTDKQNRVLEVTPATEKGMVNIHVNDEPNKVDVTNMVHISMIMALEDISFAEAKAYYDKMLSGRITNSDKVNYDSECFKSILKPTAQTGGTVAPTEKKYALRKMDDAELMSMLDATVYNNDVYYICNPNSFDAEDVYVGKLNVENGKTEEFYDPSALEYEGEYNNEDVLFYDFYAEQVFYDKENNKLLMSGAYTKFEDEDGDERAISRNQTFVYDITNGKAKLYCKYMYGNCGILWAKDDYLILSNGYWLNVDTEEVIEGYDGSYFMEHNGEIYRIVDGTVIQKKSDSKEDNMFYNINPLIYVEGFAVGEGCYYMYKPGIAAEKNGKIIKYYVESQDESEFIRECPIKELQMLDSTFFVINEDCFVFYDHDTEAFYALEAK